MTKDKRSIWRAYARAGLWWIFSISLTLGAMLAGVYLIALSGGRLP